MKLFNPSLISLASAVALCGSASAAVSFNEIRIDQSGADDDEFVEFFTTDASESLDAHTLLVLGDGVRRIRCH